MRKVTIEFDFSGEDGYDQKQDYKLMMLSHDMASDLYAIFNKLNAERRLNEIAELVSRTNWMDYYE
jgi:hypothetical protein